MDPKDPKDPKDFKDLKDPKDFKDLKDFKDPRVLMTLRSGALGFLAGLAAHEGVEEDVGKAGDDNPVGGLVAGDAEDVDHGVHQQR